VTKSRRARGPRSAWSSIFWEMAVQGPASTRERGDAAPQLITSMTDHCRNERQECRRSAIGGPSARPGKVTVRCRPIDSGTGAPSERRVRSRRGCLASIDDGDEMLHRLLSVSCSRCSGGGAKRDLGPASCPDREFAPVGCRIPIESARFLSSALTTGRKGPGGFLRSGEQETSRPWLWNNPPTIAEITSIGRASSVL